MTNLMVREISENELKPLLKELERDLDRNYMIHSAIELRLRCGILKNTKLVVYQATDPQYQSFMFATPMTSDEDVQSMTFTWNPKEMNDEDVGLLFSIIPNWNWNKTFLAFSSTWNMKLRFDNLFAKKCIPANTVSMMTEFPGHHGIRFAIESERVKIPELPPGYILGPLPPSAACKILSSWEYNFGESIEGLSERLEAYKGVGVFHQEKGISDLSAANLVAWTCQYMCGAIGITYTLPEHRKKGLGTVAILTLAKQILEEGRIAFLMVEVANTYSLEFHKRIGFKTIGDTGFSLYLPTVRDNTCSQCAFNSITFHKGVVAILLMGVFAVALAMPGKANIEQENPDDGKYAFKWEVDDSSSENHYGHKEQRDGGRTEGEYFVRLPDSRLMKVTYYVDKDSGFVANVEYEGDAKY